MSMKNIQVKMVERGEKKSIGRTGDGPSEIDTIMGRAREWSNEYDLRRPSKPRSDERKP